MKHSEEIGELVKALINAESDFDSIVLTKSGQAGQGKFKYADLTEVFNKTKPALRKWGLKCVGGLSPREDDKNCLTLKLFHTSGQWLESTMNLPSCTKPTEMGAILTYMRRYLYNTLLGIAADEDVEGDDLNSTFEPEEEKALSDKDILKVALGLTKNLEFSSTDRLAEYLQKIKKTLATVEDPVGTLSTPKFLAGYETWLENNKNNE